MTAYFKGQPIFGPRGPAGPDGNPVGTVISYMGQSAPKDYLACDGAAYNISEYSELAAFFQNQFGAANHFGGDGVAAFAVPDLAKEGAEALPCIKAAEGFQAQDVYSTEEIRIGTWIDGKPLYKKTTAVNRASQDLVLATDVSVIVHPYGSLIKNSADNRAIYPFPYYASPSDKCRIIISGGAAKVDTAGFNDYSLIATIVYTKTAD